MATNAQILATYDLNQTFQSPKLYPSLAIHEHAGQLIALEMLRVCTTQVANAQAYNDLSEASYLALEGQAVTVALQISGSGIHNLNDSEIHAATNLGGNFFEHTWQTIIDNTQASDEVTVQKIPL